MSAWMVWRKWVGYSSICFDDTRDGVSLRVVKISRVYSEENNSNRLLEFLK